MELRPHRDEVSRLMEQGMTRRTFARASAGAAAGLYLAGCGSSRSPGEGTVRLAGGFFGFPSPFADIAGPGYVQMSLIYDTLLWTDSTGRLLPWLARDVRRLAGGRIYRFELRPGTRWHDGRPLTAEDVAFTFEYFRSQPLGPLVVAQPAGVKDARALDDLTVEVELEIPAVTFLRSVAGAVPIIPKHIWSTIDDAPRAQSRSVLVGSGPYRLDSYSPGEGSYLFLANDRYFLGRPFMRRIELVPVDDELVALQAGEIDSANTPAEGVGEDALAPFRADSRYGIVESSGGFSFPLIWNLGRGGALADVRFRRACALAIDRQAIVDRLLGGNGVPGNPGFLPPDHPFHVPTEQYGFDPRAAQRLLDAAGYSRSSPSGVREDPAGVPLQFEILTGNSPIPPMLDLLTESLRAIGVELKPRSVDLPTLFGRLQEGSDEIALSLYPGPGGMAPNADPDTLRTFYSSRIMGRLQGAQGYSDQRFDRLAERQLVTADRAERMRLIAAMQEIVARDLPALPLYYPKLFNAFRRDVFDRWYYTPGGFAGGLPGVDNKQVLITGSTTGLKIRPRPG